jgi:3-deoxy-D-manno-octulosonic-acid transferase
MGEFEQAKPVIEEIKKTNLEIQIIVTFYSPSGYINQINYKYADAVLYMPFDSYLNARSFINKISPDFAVFVRYDFWRNHLSILDKMSIPTFLICATKPNSLALTTYPFFKSFLSSTLCLFKGIYTVGEKHTQFFKQIGCSSVETTTDTRFDRIISNVENAKLNTVLPKEIFEKGEFILVAGSTWEPDEEIISNAIERINTENRIKVRLIIVPHEPTETHLAYSKSELPNSLFLSEILDLISAGKGTNDIKQFLGSKHIIVDSIGKLLKLYGNASCAYIGGAFGAGVHSVTEPAGYGIPLFTGINISSSPDAEKLFELGALQKVSNQNDLYEGLKEILENNEKTTRISRIAHDYVYNQSGSSNYISGVILKTI